MSWPPPPQRNYLSPNQQLYVLMQGLSLVFFIAGPLLIGLGVYDNHRDSPSLKWPATTGKIVKYDKIGSSHRYGGWISVTYAYSVNGANYTGQRYALWSNYLKYVGWDYVHARPASSSVDVYYDPRDPESAVLVPGPDYQANRNITWGGVALIVLAIVFRIKMLKFHASANAPFGKAL